MRTLTLGLITLSLAAFGAMPQAGADTKVDEAGLRYFVGAGQIERAKAEIRRLQLLHPDWKVPERVFEQRPASQDESSFWTLYSAGQFEEAAQAIDARRIQQNGFTPSSELQEKLQAALLRTKVMGFAKSNSWSAIAALVPEDPLTEATDLQTRWTVAEALARDGQSERAQATYRAILATQSDPAQRLATLQKALGCLRVEEVDALVPPEARGAVLGLELLRARIAAHLRGADAAPPTLEDLASFTEQARQDRSGRDLALLGWYHLRKGRMNEASDLFRKALERDQNALTAHGLALSLLDLGRVVEAEDTAFLWRQGTVNNLVLYLDIVERRLMAANATEIEPERLSRFSTVTIEAASGEAAQALGWYAYTRCRFDLARDWFELAMAWKPRESTALGYALTLMKGSKRKAALEIINRYDGLFPKVVAVLAPDPRSNHGACEAPVPAQAAAQRFMSIPSPTQPINLAAVKTADYPIAVAPQNELRFPKQGSTQESGTTRLAAYAPEPVSGPWPRQTRGVVGSVPVAQRAIPTPAWATQEARRP